MEEKCKDCYVPIGVWIFWGIVVAVLIIWLISRMRNGMAILNIVIQLLTAVAGAAAAIAAFRTVRVANESLNQVRADKNRELDLRKPNFVFTDGMIGLVEDDYNYFVAHFKNTGIHPAKNINAKLTLIEQNLKDDPELLLTTTVANEIASQYDFDFSFGDFKLKYMAEPYYVTFTVSYKDSFTNKSYSQVYFLKWVGIRDFESSQIIHVSKAESEKVAKRLSEYVASRKALSSKTTASVTKEI
jgi:hypothetical protein